MVFKCNQLWLSLQQTQGWNEEAYIYAIYCKLAKHRNTMKFYFYAKGPLDLHAGRLSLLNHSALHPPQKLLRHFVASLQGGELNWHGSTKQLTIFELAHVQSRLQHTLREPRNFFCSSVRPLTRAFVPQREISDFPNGFSWRIYLTLSWSLMPQVADWIGVSATAYFELMQPPYERWVRKMYTRLPLKLDPVVYVNTGVASVYGVPAFSAR